MARFSDDVDILKYEPVLFGELAMLGQVLCSGTGGDLSGVTLSDSEADFSAAPIEAGMVIYISGEGKSGVYEIVSVESATELSVSVLRLDSQSQAVMDMQGSDMTYRICSYRVQAEQVGYELTEYFGIQPGRADSDYGVDDILDAEVLRVVSVYGVMSMLYASLGSGREESDLWGKSEYYRKLYEKARSRIRLCIDAGSDGVSDTVRLGGCVRLVRG